MISYEDALDVHKRAMDRAALEQINLHVLHNVAEMANEAMMTGNDRLMEVAVTLCTRHWHSMAPLEEHARITAMSREEGHRATMKIVSEMLSNPEYWAKQLSKGYAEKLATLPTVWVSPNALEEAKQNPVTHMPAKETIPFAEGCIVVLGEPERAQGQFYDTIHGMIYWPINDEKAFLSTLSSREASMEEADEETRTALRRLGKVATVTGHVTPDMLGTQVYGAPINSRVQDKDPVVQVLGDQARSEDQAALTADILGLLTRENASEASIAVAGVSSRDAKRAAKKAGIKPEINVIYLRDEKAKVIGGSGTGGNVSRHMVRAHWRWQPYGPGRKFRRWQLISSYPRGSGEMDERERVYVEGRA